MPALPHLGRDGIPGERGAPQAVGRERGTEREMERQGDAEEEDRGQGRGRAGSQRLSPSKASRPLLPCRGPCWEQPWEAGCAAGTRAGPSLAPCAHLQVDSAVV